MHGHLSAHLAWLAFFLGGWVCAAGAPPACSPAGAPQRLAFSATAEPPAGPPVMPAVRATPVVPMASVMRAALPARLPISGTGRLPPTHPPTLVPTRTPHAHLSTRPADPLPPLPTPAAQVPLILGERWLLGQLKTAGLALPGVARRSLTLVRCRRRGHALAGGTCLEGGTASRGAARVLQPEPHPRLAGVHFRARGLQLQAPQTGRLDRAVPSRSTHRSSSPGLRRGCCWPPRTACFSSRQRQQGCPPSSRPACASRTPRWLHCRCACWAALHHTPALHS